MERGHAGGCQQVANLHEAQLLQKVSSKHFRLIKLLHPLSLCHHCSRPNLEVEKIEFSKSRVFFQPSRGSGRRLDEKEASAAEVLAKYGGRSGGKLVQQTTEDYLKDGLRDNGGGENKN